MSVISTSSRVVSLDVSEDYSNAMLTERAADTPANGGRVVQLALAELADVGHPQHPRDAALRFLAPTTYRGVTAHYRTMRASPSSAVVAVDIRQHDAVTITGHVTLADTGQPPPIDHSMPRVGPPDDYAPPPPEHLTYFSRHVDYRYVERPALFGGVEHAEVLVWLRPDTGYTAAALAFLCDCSYATPILAAATPTSAVTAAYHLTWCGDTRTPIDGWLLARIVLRSWQGRWASEDATLWSAAGELLGFSRQTLRVFAQPTRSRRSPTAPGTTDGLRPCPPPARSTL